MAQILIHIVFYLYLVTFIKGPYKFLFNLQSSRTFNGAFYQIHPEPNQITK